MNDSGMFIKNRERLAAEMESNSIFIAFSNSAPVRSGDQYYPFSPRRNFYYLTGIARPNIIFTLHKTADGKVNETLYLERFDEVGAKWDGAVLSKEEAARISGIETTRLIENFNRAVGAVVNSADRLKIYMDFDNKAWNARPSSETEFALQIRERYPFAELINANRIFAKLRVIKSDEEVKCIEEAIKITGDGINLMMQNAKPGMMEYEIEAYFDYHLTKNGVKEKAFHTIAASGKNATILHYSANTAKTGDNDLILFDLGATCGFYSADITRTFPVSGKFTERQKLLYNIVLEANRRVIEKIKPGLDFKELNKTVIDFYAEELKRIGLIKENDEVSKYYYHGVSHMLGLDTHDIGRGNETILKEGMVLTVEPGLYIEEESIGIRIEDDILVTKDGHKVLSEDIIRTVEDIEAFMANAKA